MEPGSVHPLLMPHVLEEIFKSKNLTKEDLLNCRSVCQEWRVFATAAYRNSYRDVSTLPLDRDNFPIMEHMTSTIALFRSPHENVPLPGKVLFDGDIFLGRGKYLNDFQSIVTRFLRMIAPQVRVLALSNPIICTDVWDRQLKLPQFDFLQLRTFEISVTEDPAEQHYCTSLNTYFFQLSKIVLTRSPRLEEVNIDVAACAERSRREFDELFGYIPNTVQKLKIRTEWRALPYYLEERMNLPNLRSLNLGNITGLRFQNFHRIMLGFNNKLIALTIEEMITGGIKFPVFPFLKTLNLKLGPGLRGVPHSIQPFSTIFPQVENLNMPALGLGLENEAILESLFPPGFSAPQVKSFTFPEFPIGQEATMNIALGFSNLKSLAINPEHWCRQLSPLPIVFMCMIELEDLVLYSSTWKSSKNLTWIDSILTGIGRDQCVCIRTADNYDTVNLEDVKSFPGITDLKKLKSLRIELPPKFCLSDITGYLGILKMESLTELSMGSLHMTSKCSERLNLRFGKDSVLNPQLNRGKFLKIVSTEEGGFNCTSGI